MITVLERLEALSRERETRVWSHEDRLTIYDALPDLLAVAKAAHALVGGQPSAFRGTCIEAAVAPLLREVEE